MNNNSIGVKDDLITKAEDESSLSDGVDTFLNKALTRSYFSFENVRFTPKVIEFIDAFEGKQFAMNINIQNVGRNPVLVKIGEPNSFIFQLKKPSRRTKFLAAGTCLTKTITYTYHNVDLIQKSQIPVQINGHFVDYPIVVKKAVPYIEIQPQKLDFNVINLGASAKTLVLTIFNKGGKRTKFKIDVGKNVLDLVVTPMRGTIKAKNQVNVLVEMMGFSEGEYFHEIWIKTNELPIRVPVLVKVVRPRLEIVYPNGTEDFTLITFKPTFNGTQKAHSFILKNCSTDTTLFNTLAEVEGKLQTMESARSSTDAFSMFQITAEEGRLEPFEKRILTVLFRPKARIMQKSWQHKQNEKKEAQWEHIVFLRINRVHRIERKPEAKSEMDITKHSVIERIESLLQSPSTLPSVSSTKINRTFDYTSEVEEETTDRRSNFFTESYIPEEKVLRLCLHGNAVDPDILIQPVSFEFGDLHLGQTENKVLRITNQSSIPVLCRLSKVVNVKATPREIWLKNEKSREFVVSLTPKCAGIFKTKMKIHILAQSDIVYDSDKALATVAVYTVTLSYIARDICVVPEPKMGLGITPLVIDEVGFQKDLVKYKDASKFPSAAMLGVKHGFKTPWMQKEKDKLNNVDNAIVALPNDRPRLFYAWPKNKICRTIFSGFFRYAPPEDLQYTLSSEEKKQRKDHYGLWVDHMKLLKELRKKNYPNPEELKRCMEYDVSCRKHYKMEQIKPSRNLSSISQNINMVKNCFKGHEDEPEYTLVPLSPLLLCNVIVEPKFMNFNKVAVSTVAEKTVSISNKNSFPISIKFVSGKSAVSVMKEDTITIQSSATKYIQVMFQSSDLGRYFGFLNYVINGSHEFKITISAFVTSKTVILGDGPGVIEVGIYSTKDAFQPRSTFVPMENLLQSPIKYRWVISPDSAFSINITEGEIPPRSRLLAEVLFDPCPKKSFYSEMCLISESGISEAVKLVHPSKKVAVNFLSNRIDLHDIPLNLPTKVKAVIQNVCYHDVAFEVLDANPVPGITIEPKQGLLKARSFFPLDIKIQIPVIMKFTFHVVLLVHFVNKISVKITGNVVVPLIRMKPSEIVLRKICARSLETFAICVENVGTTPAEVVVDFKNCPEYKISDNNDKLFLKPKQTSKFLIQFEPSDVARYMFYLPVTVNKILGPPEMQEPETEFVHFYIEKFESFYEEHGDVFDSKSSNLKIPCVCLNSTVTQSLLKILPMTINFKKDCKVQTEFQPETIIFSNDASDVVTFCIRNDDLGESNNSPFDLIPIIPNSVENRLKSMKAQLIQGEQLVMKAIFEPKKPGIYSVDVPVFVRGYSNGLVYNFIRLRGELKSPHICTEVSEIHFPPLPLDVGCDVIVMICAENYTAPDTINCIVCDPQEDNGELTDQCIRTKWLNEPKVSGYQKNFSFQLLVSFRSSIPVALRNYILLFDSTGNYSSIFVTAVADNSAITTHAFLCTRSTKYRLIRDRPAPIWKADDFPGYPVSRSELKLLEKNLKDKKTESKVTVEIPESNINNNACSLRIDRGPKLVVQETKSMTRSTQLGFVNVSRHFLDCGTSSSTFLFPTKSKILSPFISKSESISGSRVILNNPLLRRTDLTNDVSYPNFPVQECGYKKHFEDTLKYVERWMFEVIMKCDQYYSIPLSFHTLNEYKKPKKSSRKIKVEVPIPETQVQKDFLDFLQEVFGRDVNLPKRLVSDETITPEYKAIKLQSVYAEILRLLENKGCLLPHVKPEYLMEYENYIRYMNEVKNIETFSWRNIELQKMNSLKLLQDVTGKNRVEKEGNLRQSSSIFSSRESWKKSLFEEFARGSDSEIDKAEDKNPEPLDPVFKNLEPFQHLVLGKQFEHEVEILDKNNFEQRSIQCWLDIVTQIFRNFVLQKVVLKSTIPRISVIGIGDKISTVTVDLNNCWDNSKKSIDMETVSDSDPLISNVFTVQERILMDWLNRHYQIQEKILWNYKSEKESPSYQRVINNFDKDLSDSVALISVTASHCPYIVSDYFNDVFFKPDTPNELYHNAGKLIQAWRTLEIGLTVETSDIVQPNPVFMVILVTQLYEVLPSLHPHSLICFSAPLNSVITRTIQLKNEFQQRIFYKAKFFGEFERYFSLGNSPMIELKPVGVTEVHITFSARKVKRTSATLILCGSCVSPDFAKHLAFYLEGEPSELPEHEKYSFSALLYKVVCFAIPVRPPYTEPTTYEVWYTTKQPKYSEFVDIDAVIKPWSKIWNRKISRRLFLNASEVKIVDVEQETTLGVTVACLTEQIRNFWLLFRSQIGDFIIMIEIRPKLLQTETALIAFYPDSWSPSANCLCSDGKELPKPNTVSAGNCPFLTELKIPARNELLWNALWSMFLKTLQPHEKSFWNEHFEIDIGICLILWLLSPEEEEEVIDEFVQVLPTRVTYKLEVEAPNDVYVIIPSSIEILDVRQKSYISLPIHISKTAPSTLDFTLKMTSQNGKELRYLSVRVMPSRDTEETDSLSSTPSVLRPPKNLCAF